MTMKTPGEDMFSKDKTHDPGYTIWKEIVGTMIGIAPFALAFFVWMSSVQTRLAVLEEARTSQSLRDTAQDLAIKDSVTRIEMRLERISSYLTAIVTTK